MATHSSILAWRSPRAEEPGIHEVAESWTHYSDLARTPSGVFWVVMFRPCRF